MYLFIMNKIKYIYYHIHLMGILVLAPKIAILNGVVIENEGCTGIVLTKLAEICQIESGTGNTVNDYEIIH